MRIELWVWFMLKEGFAKPHQQSSRTLIRDLQTAVQLLNDDQNLVLMLIVGFAKPSKTLYGLYLD